MKILGQNKIQRGIILGALAGAIDIVPMLMQNLTWDANVSAFVLWVVSGFIISTSGLKMKAPLKGLLISLLVLAPCAVLIGWAQPFSLVPILVMTVILGSLLGYLIEK